MMTADNIREAFLSRMAADTAFKAATGATSDDSRINAKDQADGDVSEQKPAYVTYMLLPMGETSNGLVQPTFSIIIWSSSSHRCRAI